MQIPDTFFIIYQPPYRVPSIFDLHPRGTFKKRPFVTEPIGFRVLANEEGHVKLQCAWLESNCGSERGTPRDFRVEERLLDLDPTLVIDSETLGKKLPDEKACKVVAEMLDRWREGFLPKRDSDPSIEHKLLSAITEHKTRLRNELVHKNHDWIMAGLARVLQDFRLYLYPEVRELAYLIYRELGGESDEARMIRHIVLFLHIFEHQDSDLFIPHNWGGYLSSDQAWECWTGFTGAEEESRRLCETMERVFTPLAEKLTA